MPTRFASVVKRSLKAMAALALNPPPLAEGARWVALPAAED
jgi:hypothetical protein